MNRRSRDTTAPRRPTGARQAPTPRPESALDEAASLIRASWAKPQRVGPLF